MDRLVWFRVHTTYSFMLLLPAEPVLNLVTLLLLVTVGD